MSYPSQDRDLEKHERDQIKELTRNNNHLGAHAMVADIATHYKAKRVFEALHEIALCEGETTHEMYLIENKWRKYLYTWIERGYGGKVGKEAKRCL